MTSFFLSFIGIYFLLGFLFSIAFAWKGVHQIDTAAVGTSWKFRLLIVPGSWIFWPLLLRKWMKSNKQTSS